eukprot:gene17913-799_t
MTTSINALVRFRPSDDQPLCWKYSTTQVTGASNIQYSFDGVHGPNTSNIALYTQTVKNQVVEPVIANNVNGCIVAYGATGSGKTHTIRGPEGTNEGIMHHAMRDILTAFQDKDNATVQCSYVELYQEKLYDLFAEKQLDGHLPEIKLIEQNTGKTDVKGNIWAPISNMKDFNEHIKKGENNRHYTATKLNQESSRSHVIMMI